LSLPAMRKGGEKKKLVETKSDEICEGEFIWRLRPSRRNGGSGA